MAVLEVRNITKKYTAGYKTSITAVNGASFDVNAGEVVGFIGPNGAGKSTTMKIITGLSYANSGSVLIEGRDIIKERAIALENVGAIVESPDFYIEWSGIENLRYLASISNIPVPDSSENLTKKEIRESRINELLKLVGLQERKNDKVKKYSYGMKQRLGIAQALISVPKLLVLDEPNNGLDPNGIIEMRNILRHLAHKNNMAVLVSSHQLAEMQLLCDRFIIINKGKIIAMPDKEELSAGEGKTMTLLTDNIVGARDMLKEKFGIEAIMKSGCVEFKTSMDTGEITKTLILNDISVKGISVKESTLEDLFLSLTQKEER